jgi:mycothiol synthase
MDVTDRHLAIPAGFRVRRPSPADAGAVARVKRSVELARHGDSEVDEEAVREEWALPRLDLGRDIWLVEDGSGTPVAYALCWVETPPAEMVAEQSVDPAVRGRGLSAYLLGLCEARAAEVLAAARTDGGSLSVWSHETDEPRIALYERRGFAHIRTFLRLDRDLDDTLGPPEWPAEIRVAAFRPGVDDAAVYAAHEEGFADHPGGGEADLEEWLASRFAHGGPDFGLWLLAWEGEEVVGGIEAMETPAGAYMGELFVRGAWRGRGIAKALMLEECAELRRRGMRNAFFAVDTANTTGALELHRSLGFLPRHGRTLLFEKELGTGGT